jgi:Bacterial type II/III secretion system short domain
MNARIAMLVVLASMVTLRSMYGQEPPTPVQSARARRTTPAVQPPVESGPLVTLEVLLIDHKLSDKDGSTASSAAELVKLNKEGKLDRVMRVQLSSAAGSPATAQLGEQVPVATSRTPRGFGGRGADPDGGFAYSYTMENVGTLVRANSRVEENGNVLVDLHVERSQLTKHDEAGDEPRDGAIGRQKTVRVTSESTLRLKPREPAIAEAWQSTAGQDTAGIFVVVTASVEPGGAERTAANDRDRNTQVRVFALQTAKAANMLRVLAQVYGDKPMRMSADEAQNAIIVAAPPEHLQAVEELIRALDQERNK